MSRKQMDEMTIKEHIEEALRLLDGPDSDTDDWDALRADNVRTAQAHIALASFIKLATNVAGIEVALADLGQWSR